MKKFVSILVLLTFVLAACTSQPAAPSPTAEVPTAESLEAPTEVPSPTVEPISEDLTALQANPWQWTGFTNPVEQFSVEDPTSYTLTFNEDGTVNILADCNNANGTYTAEGSSLTIEVGPMTMAACPPESRSDQFVEYLGSAAIYFFEEGNLYIDLMADGGTMEFAPFSASAVLTASLWEWVGFAGAADEYMVEDPTNYTLTFNEDGTVNILADCNNASGAYTVEDSSLSIEVGPMTMAACPEGSRSDEFVTYLGSASSYSFVSSILFIELMDDGGSMEFAPVSPTAALTANPWQWTAFTNPVEQFAVEDSQSYMVTFKEDGTVNILADCNNANGVYTVEDSSLSIEVGPMTMAACPEGSRSDEFVTYLSSAVIYFFENDMLIIDLMADGGTMEFAKAASLTGNGWRWEQFAGPDEQFEVPEPNKYTLVFVNEGNLVVIVADCNTVVGSYTVEGQNLTIEPGPTTLAACPEESLSDQFITYLQSAETYTLEDGRLSVELAAEGGTLEFGFFDPIQAALEANRVASWDEAFAKVMTDSEFCDAPGAILLADTPQGRYLKVQGLASTEEGTPIAVTDAFEIGSNTKSFTTALALLLQEDGVWSLDDPLIKYLPEQAAKLTYGDQVTLRQLGRNNSGIPDYADPIIGDAILNDNLEQGYTPEELVGYVVENLEPNFAPGEDWEYSTTNFVLLGMAIEAVTGKTLGELYQERIFDPLEMTNSFLLEGVPEDGQIIQGYYTNEETGEVKNVTAWNGSQGWAGGGIVSTAEDMAKYAAGLASGALFKDPASLEQMIDFGDGVVATFDGYGLGVGRWSREPLGWGHGGETPGFQTFFAIYPEMDSQVVLLTNSGSCHVGYFAGVLSASPDLFTQALP